MKQITYLFFPIVFSLFFIACGVVKPVVIETKPDQENLTVVFTSNTMGAFEPEGCGCRNKGGLPRRSSFINDARQRYPSVIAIDTGNILPGNEDKSKTELREKADFMLAALNQMGLDVLNVGYTDCAMGIAYIKEKENKLPFPLISANIKSNSTGKLVFRPYVIKNIDRYKIGIFGLSGYGNPLRLKAEDIYIENPLESAADTVKELKDNGCNFIILLSQLTQAQNIKVARQVQRINFILGSSSKDLLEKSEEECGAMILSPGAGGKHAGMLDIFFKNDSSFFYNTKSRASVVEKIEALKKEEINPAKSSEINETLSKIALLEEKIKTFDAGNLYNYSVVALNSSIPDDPGVYLLVEQYKADILRNKLAKYTDRVQAVDLSTLPEEKKVMAIRLMNEIECNETGSIAASSAEDSFCRKLAGIIVDSIKRGESEGKIGYTLIYEKEKRKKSLDKDLMLP